MGGLTSRKVGPGPKKMFPQEVQPVAGGGCENDPAKQTMAIPRRSHFKGIDH